VTLVQSLDIAFRLTEGPEIEESWNQVVDPMFDASLNLDKSEPECPKDVQRLLVLIQTSELEVLVDDAGEKASA